MSAQETTKVEGTETKKAPRKPASQPKASSATKKTPAKPAATKTETPATKKTTSKGGTKLCMFVQDKNGQMRHKITSQFANKSAASRILREQGIKVCWALTMAELIMIRKRKTLKPAQIQEVNPNTHDAASGEDFYKRVLSYVDGMKAADIKEA